MLHDERDDPWADAASDVSRQFADLTLPREQWTHEAHLEVCWFAVMRMGADDALTHLREAIRRYNIATGGTNTDSSGYHETLTRYFIGAVASVAAQPDGSLDRVLTDTACSRQAPLTYWQRETLMSTAARRSWVAPDLRPLP